MCTLASLTRTVLPQQRRLLALRNLLACALTTLAACTARPVLVPPTVSQSQMEFVVVTEAPTALDLLVVMDNSGSMRDKQGRLVAQLSALIARISDPLCISRTAPNGGPTHRCDPLNPDDTPDHYPLHDLHVGVISTDLGTPGAIVQGCEDSDRGDDGLLNPIRNGPALQIHLPWAVRRRSAELAPEGFRPAACNNNPAQFPGFIAFCSDRADPSCDRPGSFASTRDPNVFADWFRCNAALWINGCSVESPLEAIWRALVQHDASSSADNRSPNAGFLRDGAYLALVVVTDEDDASVRNCDNDQGFSRQNATPCIDARGVFARAQWPSPPLAQRLDRYQPGSEQDPTWDLDRYYNTRPAGTPSRWMRDLLSLKPGYPERIFFAAIVGAPLQIPYQSDHRSVDWDALLGAPDPHDRDDFVHRDARTALAGTQGTAGPFSMHVADVDLQCPQHVVPACRAHDSTLDPAQPCAATDHSVGQIAAFPSRRILEIARRFDQYPACHGAPCHNASVTSVCAPEITTAFDGLIAQWRPRSTTRCFSHPVLSTRQPDGTLRATCRMIEAQPIGQTSCDLSRGRVPLAANDQLASESFEGTTQCEVQQINTLPPGHPREHFAATEAPGWFIDRRDFSWERICNERVGFNSSGQPAPRTHFALFCIAENGAP